MFCSECGNELPDDSHFCTHCGAGTSKPGAPPAQPGKTPETPPSGPTPPKAGPTEQMPPVQSTVQAVAPPPAEPPPMPPDITGAAPSGKPKKSIKWAIIGVTSLVVIAVIVVVWLFVFVYGGDTGKARDLVKKSDAIITKLNSKGDELGSSANDLMHSVKTFSSTSDSAQMADKVRQEAGSIKSDLNNASNGYRQILKMNGVQRYKEYAREALILIDVDFQQVKEFNDYLDYLGSQFKAAKTGQSVSEAEVAAKTTAFVRKVKSLAPNITYVKSVLDSLRKGL